MNGIEPPKHRLSIVVDQQEVRNPLTYRVERSMTDGIDQFEFEFPFSREAWNLLATDRPCRVLVDDVPILTGFIDDSNTPDGLVIKVGGRCKLGRFVQDCPPGINFAGLGIKELIEKLARPLFTKVTFTNARNRTLARGKGKKARASSEPVRLNTRVGTRIEPGQTRWSIIEQLLEQAGYLAWSSGDGTELIVGQPNYDQEAQFLFYRPVPGSVRAATVQSLAIRRSTGDRFSRVIVVGSGQGTDANYGPRVASRYGSARHNTETPNGEGGDFTAPKVLVIQRSVKSAAQAQELAEAEMARRDAQADMVDIGAAGHGQLIAGTRRTLFAPDLLANVVCERTGVRRPYLIESCTFEGGRDEAETSSMTLVRKGAVLSR